MITWKEDKIIKKLLQQPSVTSKEFEDVLNVSNKTARKMILQTNFELQLHGAEIVSKPGKGYHLTITDEKAFYSFINNHVDKFAVDLEGRSKLIVIFFIENTSYIKIEDLADMLYTSRNVVSKSIKKAELILNNFNLHFERRPHFGIRLVGSEYDIRRCLLFLENEKDFLTIKSQISKVVNYVFIKHKIKMSDTALASFLLYLQISVERIKEGKFVEFSKLEFDFFSENLLRDNLEAANECVELLEKEFDISFMQDEVHNIALQIADKKYYESNNENIIVDEEISRLVTDILKNIFSTYGLDFRKDLDIYMMLVKHLIPLRLRILGGNMIKNPILKEVKEKYRFALSISAGLNPIIEQYFHKRLSEDELSYIALAIELVFEKQIASEKNKKNILLVCSSDNVCACFFKYRFEELFRECIESSQICDYADLINYDFSNIDYVFSTVPIHIKLPVSIFQVEYFLDEIMVNNIKTILTRTEGRITKYFSDQLFLSNIKAKSKQDVIKIMCDHISTVKKIPPEFYNLVIKRENMLHTALSEQVAIPHPYHTITTDTFVCVSTLAEPVTWGDEKVSVVFLVSIAQNNKDNIENFYNDLFKLVLSKEKIDKLLKNPEFDNLIALVNLI